MRRYDGALGRFSYDDELYEILPITKELKERFPLIAQTSFTEFLHYKGPLESGRFVGVLPKADTFVMLFLDRLDLLEPVEEQYLPKYVEHCYTYAGCYNMRIDNLPFLRSYCDFTRLGGVRKDWWFNPIDFGRDEEEKCVIGALTECSREEAGLWLQQCGDSVKVCGLPEVRNRLTIGTYMTVNGEKIVVDPISCPTKQDLENIRLCEEQVVITKDYRQRTIWLGDFDLPYFDPQKFNLVAINRDVHLYEDTTTVTLSGTGALVIHGNRRVHGVFVERVKELTLKGTQADILIIEGQLNQACIGTKDSDSVWINDLTTDHCFSIHVDGVKVVCQPTEKNFSLGQFGQRSIPEISLVNGGVLECPEMYGVRLRKDIEWDTRYTIEEQPSRVGMEFYNGKLGTFFYNPEHWEIREIQTELRDRFPLLEHFTEHLAYVGPLEDGVLPESVEIPKADFFVLTFYNCKDLKKVPKLPGIKVYAYAGCENLSSYNYDSLFRFQSWGKLFEGLTEDWWFNYDVVRSLTKNDNEAHVLATLGAVLETGLDTLTSAFPGIAELSDKDYLSYLDSNTGKVRAGIHPTIEGNFITVHKDEAPRKLAYIHLCTDNVVVCGGSSDALGCDVWIGDFNFNPCSYEIMNQRCAIQRSFRLVGEGTSAIRVSNAVKVQGAASCTGIFVSGTNEIHIEGIGEGAVLTINGEHMNACIGVKTHTGMSYGRWEPGFGNCKKIVLDNVRVVCNSAVSDFALGNFGKEEVPEIELKNGASIECPEMHGKRVMVRSGAEDLWGSTKRSCLAVYEIQEAEEMSSF